MKKLLFAFGLLSFLGIFGGRLESAVAPFPAVVCSNEPRSIETGRKWQQLNGELDNILRGIDKEALEDLAVELFENPHTRKKLVYADFTLDELNHYQIVAYFSRHPKTDRHERLRNLICKYQNFDDALWVIILRFIDAGWPRETVISSLPLKFIEFWGLVEPMNLSIDIKKSMTYEELNSRLDLILSRFFNDNGNVVDLDAKCGLTNLARELFRNPFTRLKLVYACPSLSLIGIICQPLLGFTELERGSELHREFYELIYSCFDSDDALWIIILRVFYALGSINREDNIVTSMWPYDNVD